MRLLIVNDDGIDAPGITTLARLAKQLGEVYVVAPKDQCSAMSHRITIREILQVRKEEFPVEGVEAYSVTGTPADCVKVALHSILPWKPDIICSGINNGYNVGSDILYSGTVGAAMEALLCGIPAIAFSNAMEDCFDIVEQYLVEITKDLMSRPIAVDEIWNVNFPGGALSECKGIRENCFIDSSAFYENRYTVIKQEGKNMDLQIEGFRTSKSTPGSDMDAVMQGFIAIGKVRRM